MIRYPSKLLEVAIDQISNLPSIGDRTAMRLALHMLKQPQVYTQKLTKALTSLRDNIKFCQQCHNISDTDVCEICQNPSRNKDIICVVEDIRDVMAIENTQQYKGIYHVLGGKISPIEGISPHHLNIDSLIEKCSLGQIHELIFALSPTVEGDTTSFYIYKKIENSKVKISVISKGISVGAELEYADEVTLGRSIVNRIPFEESIKK